MYKFHFVVLLSLIAFTTLAFAEPTPVSIQTLSELLSAQQYSAPASVKPLNRPKLSAEVTGQIKSIPVKIGDKVQRGDLLVELDCRAHQARLQATRAALERARIQRNFARAQLKRARNLKRKGSISIELLDQRETELSDAQSTVQTQSLQRELAELDVQNCRISAPFDALVSQRLASEGGLANPGTALIELVQLDNSEVSVELREDEADALRSVERAVFSYQAQDYAVGLRTLLPLVDERTRTREARLAFNALSAPIGAAGRLIWQGTKRLLPAQYLVRRNNQLGVFVARESKAVFIIVPDAREGQAARINLPAETQLITEGRQRLQDGDAVKVVQP